MYRKEFVFFLIIMPLTSTMAWPIFFSLSIYFVLFNVGNCTTDYLCFRFVKYFFLL